MLKRAAKDTEYVWSKDWRLLACAIATGLLLVATLRENGDGFYTFLRIYVFGLSLLLCLEFWQGGRVPWLIAAALSAILFNPLIPVEMEREDWVAYDLIAAAGFSWIAMTGPAEALGRPKLKAAPLVVAGAVAVLIAYLQAERYPVEENMEVENLAVDNLIVNDPTAIDARPYEPWLLDRIVAEPAPPNTETATPPAATTPTLDVSNLLVSPQPTRPRDEMTAGEEAEAPIENSIDVEDPPTDAPANEASELEQD